MKFALPLGLSPNHSYLLLVWLFLDLLLLSTGVLIIIASIHFHSPRHLIMGLLFRPMDFYLGLNLGAGYLVTFAVSVIGILMGRDKLLGLKILNIALLLMILGTLMYASGIWFFSLRQFDEFAQAWTHQTESIKASIQDTYSCCGYYNATTPAFVPSSFCTDLTSASAQTPCVNIITSAKSPGTDYTLCNIFTALFGFNAILLCLFLATVCIIKERQVEARFARIDEKRGGGGFI